ncbi:hypothetical protein KCU77_g24160, partial [Aureobasidium melanogenum]
YTTPAPRGTLLSTQQPPTRRNDVPQPNRPQTATSTTSSQSSNSNPAQRASQHNSVMHETLSVIDYCIHMQHGIRRPSSEPKDLSTCTVAARA